MMPPTRARPRLLRAGILAGGVLLLALACTDGESPLGPDGGPSMALQFAPVYSSLAASLSAAEINRIRIGVYLVANDSLLVVHQQDVDPTASEWQLNIEVTVPADVDPTVRLEVELISVSGNTESVEWSGTSQATLDPSSPAPVQTVNVYRGPMDNLTVQSVDVAPTADTLIESDTVRLTATVTGGGPEAQAFFGSLDASRATVSDNGLVTAHLPGPVGIVAVAGPQADTTRLQVLARVAGVALDPDTLVIAALGDTATLGMDVVDPRGDPVENTEVEWSLADTTLVQDLGDGRFVALRNGSTTVTVTGGRVNPLPSPAPARAVADTAVTTTGTIVVRQAATSLAIEQPDTTLYALGAQVAFTAAAQDANGNEVATTAIDWSVSDTTVARIDSAGVATALADGTTPVVAASGSAADTVQLTVFQTAVALEVEPDSTTLTAPGDTVRITATPTDANDSVLVARGPAWTSSDEGVATVDSTGLVTAVGSGLAHVAAAMDSVADTTVVRVRFPADTVILTPTSLQITSLGDTARLSATILDAFGDTVPGGGLSWSSSNASVATVDSTGLVRSVANGTTQVSTTIDSVSAIATVTVDQVVTTLTLNPPVDTISVGDTVAVTATGTDALGNTVTDASVSWTSSKPAAVSVETVSPVEARIVALDTGTVVIEGQADGAMGKLTLRILGATPVRLELVPRFDTVAVGGNRSFTATPYATTGQPLSDTLVTWTSLDPLVASITADGTVTGVSEGVTPLVATAAPVSDTALVAVLTDSTLLSTAFPGDSLGKEAAVGSTVTVPIVLDLSRLSATGDLGSAQLTFAYDPALLAFDTATVGVAGSATWNADTPGKVSFAMASTSDQGTPVVTLLTVQLTVLAAPDGTTTRFGLTYTDVPTRTDLTPYPGFPLTVGGGIRIVSP